MGLFTKKEKELIATQAEALTEAAQAFQREQIAHNAELQAQRNAARKATDEQGAAHAAQLEALNREADEARQAHALEVAALKGRLDEVHRQEELLHLILSGHTLRIDKECSVHNRAPQIKLVCRDCLEVAILLPEAEAKKLVVP